MSFILESNLASLTIFLLHQHHRNTKMLSIQPRDGLGRPLWRTTVLLDRDYVHSRKGHAAVVIKPHYNPAPARVNTGVIRAGNRIAVTATGHDRKRLKRGSGKMLAHIGGHGNSLVNSTRPSKRILEV